MVMVLEQAMVNEIARIGHEAFPNEACGLLIPVPMRGQSVYQLPNRSKEPLDSVEMVPADIILQMTAIYGEDEVPDDILKNITWWHTHPGGHVGPSPYDLKHKPPKLKCLVVTIWRDGTPPVATWF